MSAVVVATWDGGGNAPPAVALAVELQARGHSVTVMGHPTQRSAIEREGLDFVPYQTKRPMSGSADTNPVALVSTCGDAAMGREVAAMGADLYVVDCLLLGVMNVLKAHGERYVVLQHMYERHLTSMLATGPIALGFRFKRLDPQDLFAHAAVRIVGTLPELDRAVGVNVRQTGPLVEGVPSHPAEPTILLSLSTRGYRGIGAAWQRALDAVAPLPAKVIATSGPALEGGTYRVGANTEVHSWLPHAAVLPHVSLVLGHGGHATTMLSLAHDLPLVIVPTFRYGDQPLVGATITRAGAGEAVKKSAPTAQLRRTVQHVMSTDTYRVRAAELGSRIRQAHGIQRAADIVERLDQARHRS